MVCGCVIRVIQKSFWGRKKLMLEGKYIGERRKENIHRKQRRCTED
jgi:hypothetical protein